MMKIRNLSVRCKNLRDPIENIGKICKSLEKFFDTRTGKISVKSRPVLVIGCEDSYHSPVDVDYEILPISRLQNIIPDEEYDIFLKDGTYEKFGLKNPCYIRTHKVSWNHAKHMKIEDPIGDMKEVNPKMFNLILQKNLDWVRARNIKNVTIVPTE